MFDREGNEQYLLVNQQRDVVRRNAYLSIKRKSERVTRVPHYPKICPADEKRRQLPSACAGEALRDGLTAAALCAAATALTVARVDVSERAFHGPTSLL